MTNATCADWSWGYANTCVYLNRGSETQICIKGQCFCMNLNSCRTTVAVIFSQVEHCTRFWYGSQVGVFEKKMIHCDKNSVKYRSENYRKLSKIIENRTLIMAPLLLPLGAEPILRPWAWRNSIRLSIMCRGPEDLPVNSNTVSLTPNHVAQHQQNT